MLTRIHVRNYALIESLDLEFFLGLNIITGETGAGKSILLGALGLVRGERADVGVVRNEEKPCVVEVVYQVKGLSLESFFEKEELDYSEEVTVRRQVNASGKSRAFINDTPVTLRVLRDFSERVIDIHSQHANLLLQDAPFQLSVLDSYADTEALLTTYQKAYYHWQKELKALQALEERVRKVKAEYEFREHQYRELEAAHLKEGEEEGLETQQRELEYADRLLAYYSKAYQALRGGEGVVGALAQLQQCSTALEKIEEWSDGARVLCNRLESTSIELSDIADEVREKLSGLRADPALLDQIGTRLNLLRRLKQKHGVETVEELIECANKLQTDLDSAHEGEHALKVKRETVLTLEQKTRDVAQQLHKKRADKSEGLAEQIRSMLVSLGMEHARFGVQVEPLEELSPMGMNRVEFLFNANVQGELQSLSKVASGGELSRVMLSLKSIMAGASSLPTIVFDEIDTGVSGAVASRMGAILHAMAGRMQVINITHLPQIAAFGSHHYRVYKEHRAHDTRTLVRRLSEEERVEELAKMLSGEQITDVSLANARELLAKR